jgi:hypothetical protein
MLNLMEWKMSVERSQQKKKKQVHLSRPVESQVKLKNCSFRASRKGRDGGLKRVFSLRQQRRTFRRPRPLLPATLRTTIHSNTGAGIQLEFSLQLNSSLLLFVILSSQWITTLSKSSS